MAESVANPQKYYRNNNEASRTLIQTCIKSGIRHFIFSSTAAVYGAPTITPVPEEMPPQPINPYGQSKLATECLLRDAADAHDFNYMVLRYFNVGGADPKGRLGQAAPNATHLIKVACQVAVGNRAELEIFGSDYDTPDGTCVRDYIHVSDLASAHLQALEFLNRQEKSLVLNCGYGRGFSVLQVVDAIRRVTGVDFPVRFARRRPGDVACLIADNRRILETLDWKPAFDNLDVIVETALAWERRLVAEPLKRPSSMA